MRPKRLKKIIILLSLITLNCVATANATNPTQQSTASIMHEVYDALAYLLPLSMRDSESEAEWNSHLIDQKLKTLQGATAALREHAAGEEQEFKYLARSFDEVTANIYESFSNEWPDYAYYSLIDLLDHCVACHTLEKAAPLALFTQDLFARMDARKLTSEELTKLYIATRQFEAALKAIEKHLMNPGTSPVEADFNGFLIQFLQVSINIKNSPRTAIKFLTRYKNRDDMPFYLSRRISLWIDALREYSDALAASPTLPLAKSIFLAADTLSRGPGDSVRAVHDLIAATIVRGFLNEKSASPEQLGESYYLLGVVALRTLDGKTTVPEMEMLLAHSIKANPSGPYAKEAYALIEEFGYIEQPEDPVTGDDTTSSLVDMSLLRRLIGLR